MSKPTGSPTWTNPPEMFEHQPLGEPRAEQAFWQSVEERLAEGTAVESPFVRSVADGSAPIESVREFAHDLRTLCRELPLIQGENKCEQILTMKAWHHMTQGFLI